MAFLPGPWGFLAWFALVPYALALERWLEHGGSLRGAAALGAAFGLTFYLAGTHWIALLSNVAITVPWLKYPAWLLAGAYLALFATLAGWLTGLLVRHARVPFALAFPLAVMTAEELRASGELGFPWFQPGYSQAGYTPVIQLAAWGGVSLVTLWVLGLNVLLARAASRRRMIPAVAAAVLLGATWIGGGAVLAKAPAPRGPAIGLVQGNIPGAIKWAGGHEKEILDTFLGLSARAAQDSLRPRLLVWPETATGSYLRRQLDALIAVSEFCAHQQVSVFSGFPDYVVGADGQPRYLNAGGLFTPSGPADSIYAKRHLVPFGERMPFQGLIPALGKINLGQAEWTPGERPVLFPGGTGRFGCLVCFESIFPDLARDDVRHGATWLVNITNDEWFGRSAALGEHAAMAVFRAVENHVPVARCANPGSR